MWQKLTNDSLYVIRIFCLQRRLLGNNQRFLFELCVGKPAHIVLRGGKSERIYLSQLFNSIVLEKPYHNLNIILLVLLILGGPLPPKVAIH